MKINRFIYAFLFQGEEHGRDKSIFIGPTRARETLLYQSMTRSQGETVNQYVRCGCALFLFHIPPINAFHSLHIFVLYWIQNILLNLFFLFPLFDVTTLCGPLLHFHHFVVVVALTFAQFFYALSPVYFGFQFTYHYLPDECTLR